VSKILEKIHIGVSPLSFKVYIGYGKVVDDVFIADEKIDRTNEFVSTMLRFLQSYGGEIEITERFTEKKYRIILQPAEEVIE